MALVLKDRVQETTTTSGTGTLTLAGAVSGFDTFSASIGNGNVTYYTIFDNTAYTWEVGIGTVGAGTLARTTVLSNSSGTTSPISLAGNVAFVFCTYPAEKSINYDANDVATIGQTLGYSDTGIIGSFASTVAGYNQVIVQNKSTATNASSNLNVSNDAGTAGSNYAELGINSSTFTGTGSFNIAGASYVASASTDLTIGTYGAYSVHFVTNSSTTDSMTIFNNGGISLGGFANPGIGNMSASKFVPGYTSVTSAAGTTILTASSNYYQNLLGTTTQTFQLPDATTLLEGTTFIFDNDSTGTLTVTDNASGPIETIPGGAAGFVYLADNATVAGTWRRHAFLPASYDFNASTANFGNATITNAVWNGTTIASGYGGTGLTTFTGANNALYSSNASTLVAGTLPIEAGGTAKTTFTANGVVYGDGTNPLGVTSAGTTGQVLLANTSGAPTWGSVPSTGAVTSFQTSLSGLTPSTATTGAVTLAGTLGVLSGGTGLSSLTTGLIPYGAGTSAYSSSSALQYSVQYSAGANPILYSTNGVATGTGTLSFPTTNTGVGFYSRGGTSIGGFAIQDGQGRLNQYWNAYTDSGGVKYIVSGEAAARYQMHVNSTTGASHAWYGAPSGTAGAALTWTTMANWVSGTGGFAWISPRGTSSDFYIDINGNVGMGTTTPTNPLNVSATSGRNAPLATIQSTGATGGGSGFDVGLLVDISAYASSTSALNVKSASTSRFWVGTDGNVGIGTTSPVNLLTVESTSNVRATIRNSTETTSYGSSLDFATGSGSLSSTNVVGRVVGLITQADPSTLQSALAFHTNSGDNVSEKMRIDSSGNVGIGTTGPGVRTLAVVSATDKSTVGVFSGASYGVRIGTIAAVGGVIEGVDTTGISSYQPLVVGGSQVQFTISGTERMRIDSTGNILVAQASRGTVLTDNDLSFDMNASSNFKCTPTALGTLTFTNITSGQSGFILLVNTGGYAISAAATTEVATGTLTTISTAGTYLLSYFSDGTNVFVTNSGALA